ncbi:MAG: preprotein translocase subunit SecY, partial [Thermoprotei archaeon]
MVSYESFEPLLRVLPEVPRPPTRLPFRTRLLWTGVVLVLYLVMSQVPLYGISYSPSLVQRLFFLQIVLASRRGTLMELGIGPIVTSGLIWQILVGSRII